MILYHGSNTAIEEVDLSRALPYKDFGRGFYTTSMRGQAERMAQRVARFRGGSPTVTAFSAPDDLLERPELRTRAFDGVTLEWALFVINNRDRRFADASSSECNADLKYDVVYGPVGDDDVTFLLDQYTNGLIGLDSLRDGLEYKRASDQYSFHTPRAVVLLGKEGSYRV